MTESSEKFLKTIRFDPSDTRVYERPADPDEWAIPGGFEFAGLDGEMPTGKTRQAFSHGFLSLESFGRSTFVSVAEVADDARARLEQGLASHFLDRCGAPDREQALAAAREEIGFVCDLCADVAVGSVFALQRSFDEHGEVREVFRLADPRAARTHARVWEIVEE